MTTEMIRQMLTDWDNATPEAREAAGVLAAFHANLAEQTLIINRQMCKGVPIAEMRVLNTTLDRLRHEADLLDWAGKVTPNWALYPRAAVFYNK